MHVFREQYYAPHLLGLALDIVIDDGTVNKGTNSFLKAITETIQNVNLNNNY